MVKGISSVIATLLMLVITISLVGFAYTYISGTLTSKTSTAFSVVDALNDMVILRNDGTDPITKFTATLDGNSVNLITCINGGSPAKCGDVNMDGAILGNDRLFLNRYLGGLRTFTSDQKILADVDGDLAVTLSDHTVIGNYLAELITQSQFPATQFNPGQIRTVKPFSTLSQGRHILKLCTVQMCNPVVLTII